MYNSEKDAEQICEKMSYIDPDMKKLVSDILMHSNLPVAFGLQSAAYEQTQKALTEAVDKLKRAKILEEAHWKKIKELDTELYNRKYDFETKLGEIARFKAIFKQFFEL